MEKIVIFTKLGPGPETIIDYETGLLCNPHSPYDIAQKIIWVFENQIKATEIGKNARKEVINKFYLGKIVHLNIQFYQSLFKL